MSKHGFFLVWMEIKSELVNYSNGVMNCLTQSGGVGVARIFAIIIIRLMVIKKSLGNWDFFTLARIEWSRGFCFKFQLKW